jgi:hypothetical protein
MFLLIVIIIANGVFRSYVLEYDFEHGFSKKKKLDTLYSRYVQRFSYKYVMVFFFFYEWAVTFLQVYSPEVILL